MRVVILWRAVFQALRDGGEVNLPDRRERREMFVAVVADLRARPFDPDALKATVENQAEVAVQIQQRAQAAWLEAVADMTDTERLDYADAVDAVLRRACLRSGTLRPRRHNLPRRPASRRRDGSGSNRHSDLDCRRQRNLHRAGLRNARSTRRACRSGASHNFGHARLSCCHRPCGAGTQ